MKNIISIALVLLNLITYAQKVTVEETTEVFASGSAAAYKLTIPYASLKDVKSKWKAYLKENKAVIDDSKGVVFADNAAIKEFGTGTVDVYTRYDEKNKENAVLIAAFDFNSKFINCNDDPNNCAIAKGRLNEFGLRMATEALSQMIKTEDRKLEKLKDQQKDLEKDNKEYTENIEKYKNKTSKAENELSYTSKALEKKKDDVEIQKRVVDASSGAVDEQAKKAKKIYDNLKDDQLSLEKKERNLNNDVVDYKDKVQKNERALKQNETDQSRKKTEIETQSAILEKTKDKMKVLTGE